MDPFRELVLGNTYEQYRSLCSQIKLLQYCHRTSSKKKKASDAEGSIKFLPHDLKQEDVEDIMKNQRRRLSNLQRVMMDFWNLAREGPTTGATDPRSC